MEHNWKSGDSEMWKSMWIDLSEWAENIKILVSYVSARQRVSSAEEDFYNQVGSMMHSLNTSQPLSPAMSVIAQKAHEQSGHGGTNGGFTRSPQHGPLLSKTDLTMVADKCLINPDTLIWPYTLKLSATNLVVS